MKVEKWAKNGEKGQNSQPLSPIFAKHYKPLKYPVYTLAPSIDTFIRDFYRGGRVEIFHMGRVPRDTLYYLELIVAIS